VAGAEPHPGATSKRNPIVALALAVVFTIVGFAALPSRSGASPDEKRKFLYFPLVGEMPPSVLAEAHILGPPLISPPAVGPVNIRVLFTVTSLTAAPVTEMRVFSSYSWDAFSRRHGCSDGDPGEILIVPWRPFANRWETITEPPSTAAWYDVYAQFRTATGDTSLIACATKVILGGRSQLYNDGGAVLR
jgi:hypothetical protein